MSALLFGFYGEGTRDYGFTKPVVERTLEQLLPHIDILSQDIMVNDPLDQDEIVLEVARRGDGYSLVIFHLDADARTTEQALRDRFAPGYRLVELSVEDVNQDIVPVIPVRMTEAWMLVDFEAFRQTVGTQKTGDELGFPRRPRQVEAIPEPKVVFENAIKNSRPGRRRNIPPDDVYIPLAARVRLDLLEQVPAYQEFKQHLLTTLHALHYSPVI